VEFNRSIEERFLKNLSKRSYFSLIMDVLRISLLGRPRLERGGEQIEGFTYRKSLALLFYLAMKPGRHSRHSLAGLLWGELPDANALAGLSRSLSDLRSRVGAHLDITTHNVTFNRKIPYWLDIEVFEGNVRTVLEDAGQQDSRLGVYSLREAIALYRGSLLDGFYVRNSLAFEEAITIERERLHLLAIQVLRSLIEHDLKIGALHRGIQDGSNLLTLDPLHEETHAQLMTLFALSGQRSAALRQYETCREALNAELGVEPAAETKALYESILNEEFIAEGGYQPISVLPGFDRDEQLPLHNLPAVLTPLIGKEAEIERLAQLLLDPGYRLLTVVGEGGAGKTRLALAAAETVLASFPQGVWFVPLSGVSAGDVVEPGVDSPPDLAGSKGESAKRTALTATAIADTLKLPMLGSEPPEQQVQSYLRRWKALLILDSFERLQDGVDGFVLELLGKAPELTLLVTSRQTLNLRAETVIRQEGLPFPAEFKSDLAEPWLANLDLASVARFDSVRLFAERAGRIRNGFTLDERNLPGIVEICNCLEGLPLGIELAAALAGHMEPAEILRGIQHNLDILKTNMADVPGRQRSLKAVFEGSWVLLPENEKLVLARLSVLLGEFDPSAALAIAEATNQVLSSLARKSFLQSAAAGRYRWHEIPREFASDKLNLSPRQEREWVQDRHSEFYLNRVARGESIASDEAPQELAGALWQEIRNIRQAWGWAVNRGIWSQIEASYKGLFQVYLFASRFQEGESAFREAVERLSLKLGASEEIPPDERTCLERLQFGLFINQARFLNRLGRYSQAIAISRQALEWVEKDNGAGVSAQGYLVWGMALYSQGAYQDALEKLETARRLAHESPSLEFEAESELFTGLCYKEQSRYGRAKEFIDSANDKFRLTKNQLGLVEALHGLGLVAHGSGKYPQAGEYFQDALEIARRLDIPHEQCLLLNSLGTIAELQGSYTTAEQCYRQSLRIAEFINARRTLSMVVMNFGVLLSRVGQYQQALDYYERSLRLKYELGQKRGIAWNLANLGLLYHRMGEHETALELHQRMLVLAQDLGSRSAEGIAWARLGQDLAGIGRLEEAEDSFEKALACQRELGLLHWAAETLAGLVSVALARGEVESRRESVEEILSILETHGTVGMREPFVVYLICLQALESLADKRAEDVLQDACHSLQTIAEKITDGEMRRSFMSDVLAHAELSERQLAASTTRQS
jgi:predicted ATPase/DNA-binding SARP family transcriptional activator